ncbi:hypothetical protein [Nostoc sp. LPT]|uniref:beta strand repeat-containing protein n=1 Tax=Nostoc sp. LPT TaxID=2815387 RepID=UPI001DE59BE5|nr:hypothetical protein [Nostoc sp. LPT]MBN4004281.1 S-layer family protein [Nostoc sp. LPT]
MAGQSKLRAGIDIGLGTPNSKGGDIIINAIRETTLIDQSFIANVVQERAFGNAGDINIATGTLTLRDGGSINASLFGQGNIGNVNINAQGAVTITGQKDDLASRINSAVLTGATGNSGNINITSNSFTLSNNAFLSTGILGQGNGGNISIQTSDAVELTHGFIFSNIGNGGVGNGGRINITAGSLSLTDSSQIQSRMEDSDDQLPGGRGNAGDVNINVQGDISFRNSKPEEVNGIISQVDEGARGNGVNVTINTDSLEINDGSEIQGSTRGKGNSGNIIINARNHISLDGRSSDVFSRIINAVQPTAEGNAGNIQITTGTLKATNGAFISSSTDGKGNSGNISLNALDNIAFDNNSYATSNVFDQGIGDGGNIYLKTGSLLLTNGGQILTTVSGQGNAGNITVEASDNIKLDGVFIDLDSDAFSILQSDLLIGGVGKAGNIQVTTGSLSVTNGAKISSVTAGGGNAGNITISARDNVTFSGFEGTEKFGSQVSSYGVNNAIGNGGDIRITAGNLLLQDGGQLNAQNSGQGNGGNIFLDVGNTITLDGIGGNTLTNTVNTEASNGNAGNIQIETGSLSLTNGGRISSSHGGGKGNGGNITINTRDTVRIDSVVKGVTFSSGEIDISSGLFSSLLSGEGKGGDIEITTESLSVTNGASISALTGGQGNGGNITINARNTVTFDGGKNGLFTSVGTAGTGSSTGNAGNISINTRELFLKNLGILGAFTSGQGNGGNIQVKTGTLTLKNGGGILTFAQRNAGNININTRDAVIIDGISGNNTTGAFSFLSDGGVGKGGDIQITTNSLTLSNGGQLSATSFGKGNAGDIIVNASDAIGIDGVGRKLKRYFYYFRR